MHLNLDSNPHVRFQQRLIVIRRLWATGEYCQAAIGRALGLSRVRISQIFAEELANEPPPRRNRLTSIEAAVFLGMNLHSLLRCANQRRLEGEKLATHNHQWFFSLESLEEFKRERERPKTCPVCCKTFTHPRRDRLTCSTECSRQHANHHPRSYKSVKKLTTETCPDWAKSLWERVNKSTLYGVGPTHYISVPRATQYAHVKSNTIYRLINLGLVRTRPREGRRANTGKPVIDVCLADIRFIKNNHPRFSHPRP